MNYRSVLNFNKKSNVQLEYDDTEVKLNYATNTDNETGVVTDLLQGGSSDFSTAKMTVNAVNNDFTASGLTYISGGEMSTGITIIAPGTETFDVVLYKGGQYAIFDNSSEQLTLSGDIVYNEADDYYIITGACSISL